MATILDGLVAARRRFPMVFWVSIGGSAAMIVTILLERLMPLNWQGRFIFDLALRPLGKTAYAISFLTALIVLIVLLRALAILIFRRTKTDGLRLWPPLACLLLALVAHLAIPVRVGFEAWRKEYHHAAAAIKAGDWPVSPEQTVTLPAAQRKLSLTGEAIVLKGEGRLAIFFPIARSLGDYQRWLIYVSDDRLPPLDAGSGKSGIEPAVRKLEKFWYDAMVF